MKTIDCAECNVEYTYEPPKGYPDKRKYCANCSEKKQASFSKGTGADPNRAQEVPAETSSTETTTDIQAPKSYKECHLSIEQTRTNALNAAILVFDRSNVTEIIEKIDYRKGLMELLKPPMKLLVG